MIVWWLRFFAGDRRPRECQWLLSDRPGGTQVFRIPKKQEPRIPEIPRVQYQEPRSATKKPRNQ